MHFCHITSLLDSLPSTIHQTPAKPTLGQSVENLVATTFYGKVTSMTSEMPL